MTTIETTAADLLQRTEYAVRAAKGAVTTITKMQVELQAFAAIVQATPGTLPAIGDPHPEDEGYRYFGQGPNSSLLYGHPFSVPASPADIEATLLAEGATAAVMAQVQIARANLPDIVPDHVLGDGGGKYAPLYLGETLDGKQAYTWGGSWAALPWTYPEDMLATVLAVKEIPHA